MLGPLFGILKIATKLATSIKLDTIMKKLGITPKDLLDVEERGGKIWKKVVQGCATASRNEHKNTLIVQCVQR